jgi:hypothetical protein
MNKPLIHQICRSSKLGSQSLGGLQRAYEEEKPKEKTRQRNEVLGLPTAKLDASTVPPGGKGQEGPGGLLEEREEQGGRPGTVNTSPEKVWPKRWASKRWWWWKRRTKEKFGHVM